VALGFGCQHSARLLVAGRSALRLPVVRGVSQDPFASGEKPKGKGRWNPACGDLHCYRPLWYSLGWMEARYKLRLFGH
jgi:hypothetical protein